MKKHSLVSKIVATTIPSDVLSQVDGGGPGASRQAAAGAKKAGEAMVKSFESGKPAMGSHEKDKVKQQGLDIYSNAWTKANKDSSKDAPEPFNPFSGSK